MKAPSRKSRLLITLLVILGLAIVFAGGFGTPVSSAHANPMSVQTFLGSDAAQQPTATGDLFRFIPSGIDSHNAAHAASEVVNYAEQNPLYGQALAQQTGDASFNPHNYKADGYRAHAPFGSSNSAADINGSVVPMADHGGSQAVKVVAVINIRTHRIAYVMVRCGNLRMFHVIPIPWKPIHVGVVLPINRKVVKQASITCPSGQVVTGSLVVTVKGVIYGRTYGQVQGAAKIWIKVQTDIKVKAVLTLRCGPSPIQPTAPIYIGKSCVAADDSQLAGGCPTNTFHFDTTTSDGKSFPNVVYNPDPGKDYVIAGQCTVGSTVRSVEHDVPGWQPASGTNKDQTVNCTPTGAWISFKNQEVPNTPPPPSTPTPPAPKNGTPGAGSGTTGSGGGTSSGGSGSSGGQLCTKSDGTIGHIDQFDHCT